MSYQSFVAGATAPVVVMLGLASGSAAAATPTADWSGPWVISGRASPLQTVDGKQPPLTAAGKLQYEQNRAHPASDPIKDCLPPGIPRVLTQKGFPFSIVPGVTLTGMMMQWNHLPRVIYMNQDHFENIGPGYLGQSVGRWQGEELVVDTTGFNDKTWLDDSGLPHSAALHTVERWQLKDERTLTDTIEFTDPADYSQPWTAKLTFKREPGVIVQEDYCLGRLGLGVTVSR